MTSKNQATGPFYPLLLLINLIGLPLISLAQVSSPAGPATGKLTFVNQCPYAVTIMSSTNPGINGTTLSKYVKLKNSPAQYAVALTALNANQPNNFLLAARTNATSCKKVQCQNWTTVLNPNKTTPPPQRTGAMLLAPNDTYARFCQQTNAAVNQCTKGGNNNPCCGPNENLDATFGTLFELTPFGGASQNQDFPDISTNFGTGPNSPPCVGAGPNCVAQNANIFFSVPILMQSANTCSFTSSAIQRNSLTCLTAACSDAYQTPTDDKQMTCPSASAGYQVTFCPSPNPG